MSMCLSAGPQDDLGMCHWQQRGRGARLQTDPVASAVRMDPTASVESRMHPGATGDGPTASPAKCKITSSFRAKDVTAPRQSQARAWPSPAADVDVGACGAPHRRPCPLFGGVKARPGRPCHSEPREMAGCKQGIKCRLCSASLPCASDAMGEQAVDSRRDETLADQTWTWLDLAEKRSAPPNASAPVPLSRVWWWRNEKCARWMELEKGGADDGRGLAEPDSPIPRFQLFPLFPLGPSGPLASPHVLLRSSYPSLSVIGSRAAGSWLLDPFVFSLSVRLPRPLH